MAAKKLINSIITAYENARGLNIGGAESGRRARAAALRRNVNRTTIGEYVKRSETEHLPKGATPQFAPVTAEDIDEMITPGSRAAKNKKAKRSKVAAVRGGY